jgi:hypothetical protein
MKRLLFLIIACCGLSVVGHSQFLTTLTVNQPPAALSEWYRSSTIAYVVENVSALSRPFLIKAVLKTTDGAVMAAIDLTKAQTFTVPNSRVFFAREVFPLEIAVFSGSYKSTFEKTGKLPAGAYQLEVQLVEPGTFAMLTTVQTRVFTLAAPQLPYLVMPVNHDTLSARLSETAIIFRWTPLIPRPQLPPSYRLQVFEILPYQQPLQALRGNQPLLDMIVRGQTQYIWRPQLSFSVDSIATRFIWTIQTLDGNGLPVAGSESNGEGRSEPFVFWGKRGEGGKAQ